MGGVFGNGTGSQYLGDHLCCGRDAPLGEKSLGLVLPERLRAGFSRQGQNPCFKDGDSSTSDDSNVGPMASGKIDGSSNDSGSLGIVVLIAHKGHRMGSALTGV